MTCCKCRRRGKQGRKGQPGPGGLPGIAGKQAAPSIFVSFGAAWSGFNPDYLLFNVGPDYTISAWYLNTPLPASYVYCALHDSTQIAMSVDIPATADNTGVTTQVTVYTGPPVFPVVASSSQTLVMTAPLEMQTITFPVAKGDLVWVGNVPLDPPEPDFNQMVCVQVLLTLY